MLGLGAASAGRGTPPPSPEGLAGAGAPVARAFSEPALQARFASLSPSLRALVDAPGAAGLAWLGLTPGWERLDLSNPPRLDLTAPDAAAQVEEARLINALRPISRAPLAEMPGFRLAGETEDARRALTCLTQAVYYEAAREPELGQAAVAQVILNRLRHPGYPKSVCGVVYQGSARTTGCQFTFTCDGSLSRAPDPALWANAGAVARRALSGHVVREVGAATHYHADYVAPYWAPTLVKLAQIGAHIFYRWTGPSGERGAFSGRYAGGEAFLTPAILGGVDPRTQAGLDAIAPPPPRTVTLALAGETRTYTVSEPDVAGSPALPAPGQLSPARRRPTAEEIRRINAALAAMERGETAPATESGVQP
jgi:spore germination cell wall hydrolase CwlJ-like protein